MVITNVPQGEMQNRIKVNYNEEQKDQTVYL